jgi:hypothetical protein
MPHRALSITNFSHLLDVAFAIFGSKPGSLLDHGRLHKTRENRVHPDVFRRVLHG